MGTLLFRVLVNAVALWVTALIVPGIHLAENTSGTGTKVLTVVVVAIFFGLVNAILKPFVTLISLPFIVLTLGLFTVLVNALMLIATSGVAGWFGLDFHVDGFFWSGVLGAIVLSLVSMLLSVLEPRERV